MHGHWKKKEIALLRTGNTQGQNQEAQRKVKEAQAVKEQEEEHVERNNQYFNDPQMKHHHCLQECAETMAIIEKDIEAVGKNWLM